MTEITLPVGEKKSTGGTNMTLTVPELRSKQTNPFKSQHDPSPSISSQAPEMMDEILPHFPYVATSVAHEVLEKLPFKTSNRILDDIRLSPAYFVVRPVGSLLNTRPYDYRHVVASSLARLPYSCIILNNQVDHIPSVSKSVIPGDIVSITTVRGLIVNNGRENLHHFRVQILDSQNDKKYHSTVSKHEYHLISKDMVSVDDLGFLDELAISGWENLVDDAIYKSANSSSNHLLRVSIYTSEFSEEDLVPLIDPEVIKNRYLKGIEANAAKNLSSTTIPSPLHCIQTLIKVLKGPILLPQGNPVHTIDRTKTNLDAQIDTSLLFNKLEFKVKEDEKNLVPPDLSLNRGLREAYIRKAYELVYIAKQLKVPGKVNEFDTQYSFNDNFSQIHSALGESDKATSMSMTTSDQSNRHAFFVGLSAYAYYSEELIIKCFENTVVSDPGRKLFYVDFFKKIISQRPYEAQRLQTYSNNQYLKGLMYGLLDYQNALRALGIQGAPEDVFVDEDTILELYKASCRNDYKNYIYFNKQLRIIAEIQGSKSIEKFLKEEMVVPLAAIQELRIEEATEDEVVVTAFEIRLDEVMQAVNFNATSPEVVFLQKCLVSIATVRRSFLLMAYIDNTMPELMVSGKTLTTSEAFDILSVSDLTADLDIVYAFEELAKQVDINEPSHFRDLLVALKTVAAEKNLAILDSYLRTGRVDSSLLPPLNWPTGLDNIGNTCYLNSLLQYYFCIKPLRDMILSFDERNFDLSKARSRKIGGRSVESLELKRSFQFIYRLQQLFHEMIHSNRRCVQPSKELAYLSFLPLLQPVNFRETEEFEPEHHGEVIESVEVAELVEHTEHAGKDVDPEDQTDQTLVDVADDENMEVLDVQPVENTNLVEISTISEDATPQAQFPRILSIAPDQIESAIEIGRQQDVTECIENVTFQLETALEPQLIEDDGEQYDLIKQLFCGKTKQTITPLDSDRPARSTMERFFSLIINVSDHPKNIYDALDNYFSENVVSLDEGKVKMCLTLMQLPEVFQFHVQRVLFDRERLVAYKSLEPIPFGESIFLDRYLDTDDEDILRKRREAAVWKEEIKRLVNERETLICPDPTSKLSILDSLRATSKYLSTVVLQNDQLLIKQETIDAIEMQIKMIQTKLQGINTQINKLEQQVSCQFQDYKRNGYTLFAIFIHRGEASHGHYWIYIRDMKKNIYRKYNDDTVSEVPVSEVLNFSEGNTATPYYMVYVKDEHKNEFIEPLKREISDEIGGYPL